MSLLRVTDVSHGYGDGEDRVEVLHGVSLEVAPGEVVALTGPSGSGKTALCHLVCGFEVPDVGSVTLDGRPTHEGLGWHEVAAVPQQHGLLTSMSVTENILLPTRRADPGLPVADLDPLLESLDLSTMRERAVSQTSLGEQQRTAVARALVLRPLLVVLDEPTGHQDDDHVEQVVAALAAAAAAGSAVLVASHDVAVAASADRVLTLRDGRLLT